ncbi:MAG: hypothetical protein WA672_00540 [Candidatus Angelobacter sp.]
METDIAEILELTDSNQFLKLMQRVFEDRVGSRPMFRITGTPSVLEDSPSSVKNSQLIALLENPPGRTDGWTVKPLPPLRRNALGFENDRIDWHHLKFIRNGHLEFWTAIDSSFCWNQDPESFKQHPRLYPYAVVEYPLSFCRLFSKVVRLLDIKESVVLQIQYINIKGAVLLPYRPESLGFMHPMQSVKPLDRQRLVLPKLKVPVGFDPDPVALDLIQELYFEFGYEKKHIPFFDQSGHSTLSASEL